MKCVNRLEELFVASVLTCVTVFQVGNRGCDTKDKLFEKRRAKKYKEKREQKWQQ